MIKHILYNASFFFSKNDQTTTIQCMSFKNMFKHFLSQAEGGGGRGGEHSNAEIQAVKSPALNRSNAPET